VGRRVSQDQCVHPSLVSRAHSLRRSAGYGPKGGKGAPRKPSFSSSRCRTFIFTQSPRTTFCAREECHWASVTARGG
jgi:hypothetical protein